MFNLKKTKAGFTLIELIVVLAILAIIATLAIPAYSGLKESSACSIAEANTRTAYTAAKALEVQGKLTGTATDDAAKILKMLRDGEAGFPGEIVVTLDGTGAASKIKTISWTGKVNGDVDYTATYTVADGNYTSKKVEKK